MERAHIVQSVSQLHQQDTHVVDGGQNEFLKVFCLL